jgi:outer membrane protein TolC
MIQLRIEQTLAVTVLIGLVIAPLSLASAQTAPACDSGFAVAATRLGSLIAEVRANNPRLKAAENRVEAARAAIDGKRSLDPPTIAVESYQTPLSSFPDPLRRFQEIDYSIQQMVPFPGKLASMARVEGNRMDMLGQDRSAIEQELILDVKSAFFGLYLIDRKLEILADNREITGASVEIARKQYEVGMGRQSDILRGQTELSTFKSEGVVLRQERLSAVAMINALCNALPGRSIPPVPEVHPAPVELREDSLVALAVANRPELASMRFSVAMQKNDLLAARKNFLPDFMVRGTYKQMTGLPDDWALMVGISVPVAPWSYGKYSAEEAGAASIEQGSEREYDNMKNMVVSQVQGALARVQSAQELILLYTTTVIPQARRTLQSTIDAYGSGKIEFTGLIDAHHLLRSSEVDYHTAVMNLLAGEAELDRAVGVR